MPFTKFRPGIVFEMSQEPVTLALNTLASDARPVEDSCLIAVPSDEEEGEQLEVTTDASFEAERAVGITEFVNIDNKGFSGILKHRYSDFRVIEMDLEGELALLGDKLCDEALCRLDRAREEETVTAAAVATNANGLSMDQVRATLGLALSNDERLLDDILNLSRISVKEAAGMEIQTDPIPEKSHRTTIHQTIRRLFGGALQTESSPGDIIRIYRRGSEQSSKGSRIASRDDRNSRPVGQHRFLRFVLQKENMDTIDAIQLISRRLHLSPRDLSYAGTKDKRGITSQWLVARNVTVAKVLGINKLLPSGETGNRRLQVGNVQLATHPLSLGDLVGNRFELVIRDVHLNCPTGRHEDSMDPLNASVQTMLRGLIEGFAAHGFINYYGLQRFGTSQVASHAIGAVLLRGDYRGAIELILNPRQGEGDARAEAARRHWKETGDASISQGMFPSRYTAERQVLAYLARSTNSDQEADYLGAVLAINRELRLMYVHSVQSLIWNRLVSLRVQTLGLDPVIGDLVLPPLDQGTDDETPRVPILVTAENLHQYRTRDVVMPVPGYASIYPQHAVGEAKYKEELSTLLGTHTCSSKAFRPSIKALWDLPGAYRHILVIPDGVTHQLGLYTDPDVDLPSGFTTPSPARGGQDDNVDGNDNSNGFRSDSSSRGNIPHLGLALSFNLPTSAYATMALRELMHAGTDPRHHKQRTKRHKQQ